VKDGMDRQVQPVLTDIHPGHLERYLFAGKRVSGFVLDAACGIGYGSFMLSEVAEVTGIDIEPEAIEYAKTHYAGPDYKVGNVHSIYGSFDWVVSLETIEHVKSPETALNAFRDSDNLIISTPNELEFPFKPEEHENSKYPHLRHYTPDEFEKLLNDAGWNVVEKLGQKTKSSMVSRGTGKFLVWVCS
jgi:2-polyprenyl-3-methyl-5-hydroxy-6-metoxy-1,4-benzoquinol methylase